MSQKPNTTVMNHPLIDHKLADLRDEKTPLALFKSCLEEISQFLFYEAARPLNAANKTIQTPLEPMTAKRLEKDVLLVPILRAGLGMSIGITQIMADARVGMIGMYRDHDTLEPVDYYLRLPENLTSMNIFLLDPMLATGGSAIASMDKLKSLGATEINMLTMIAAPEGVAAVEKAHPDVKLWVAALDRQLNDVGYILPGLGDAGDRYFGA